MKRAAFLPAVCAAVLFLFLLTSCFSGETAVVTEFFAMDTYMSAKVYGDADAAEIPEAESRRLEALFSVTDETSEISRINASGSLDASEDTARLISAALGICRMTDGALDITVYPAVRAWGFTTGEYRVPDDGELQAIKEMIDYSAVSVTGTAVTAPEGAALDLGAVAKGYLGDRIAALLRESGVGSALIDLGGNIVAVGAKPDGSPWRIAIRDPAAGDEGGTVGVIEATDVSVVTSGGYERYFTDEDGVRRSHIIDPSTARPADSGLLSATVVGRDGTLCDGLSTAVFVMGADRAAELWRGANGFEMILVTEGGEILLTEGIADVFTQAEGSAYGVRVIKR